MTTNLNTLSMIEKKFTLWLWHPDTLNLHCVFSSLQLHVAAANGYLSVVEFLLDHHVSTDVLDNDQWQPVHAAACWGHVSQLTLFPVSFIFIPFPSPRFSDWSHWCPALQMIEKKQCRQRTVSCIDKVIDSFVCSLSRNKIRKEYRCTQDKKNKDKEKRFSRIPILSSPVSSLDPLSFSSFFKVSCEWNRLPDSYIHQSMSVSVSCSIEWNRESTTTDSLLSLTSIHSASQAFKWHHRVFFFLSVIPSWLHF